MAPTPKCGRLPAGPDSAGVEDESIVPSDGTARCGSFLRFFLYLASDKERAMKAIRYHEFGGPEVLKFEDVPEPTLRKDQVLVEGKACALNHLDLWCRKGR